MHVQRSQVVALVLILLGSLRAMAGTGESAEAEPAPELHPQSPTSLNHAVERYEVFEQRWEETDALLASVDLTAAPSLTAPVLDDLKAHAGRLEAACLELREASAWDAAFSESQRIHPYFRRSRIYLGYLEALEKLREDYRQLLAVVLAAWPTSCEGLVACEGSAQLGEKLKTLAATRRAYCELVRLIDYANRRFDRLNAPSGERSPPQ